MPSLELRNGLYRLVFRYAGVKYARSLKTANDEVAQLALARLEDTLTRVQRGHLAVPENADPLEFFFSDGRSERRAAAPKFLRTLGQLCDRFVETFASGGLEPTTEHCIRIHIGHFKRTLGERLSLSAVDRDTLQQYVDTRAKADGQRGRKLSPTTIKKELTTLHAIWSWALDGNLVPQVLPKVKSLRFPKTADKPHFQTVAEVEWKIGLGGMKDAEIAEQWDSVFLTLEEIDEILKHVEKVSLHPCLYPMFVFAAHTGARRSEMRRCRKEDLNFTGKRVILRERKRQQGRHTLRSVPMSPLLHTVMADWFKKHPGGGDVFRLEANVSKSTKGRLESEPITDDEADHHFKQSLQGTRWARLRGWHVFRHSFCSNCAASGIDQRMINEWVGHQTEEMMRRYRHLFPNKEHAAIASVFGDQ